MTKCSQNPGLVNQLSATPRGQLNWTGPIANGSGSNSGRNRPNRVGVSGIWGWGSSGRSGSVAPSESCKSKGSHDKPSIEKGSEKGGGSQIRERALQKVLRRILRRCLVVGF